MTSELKRRFRKQDYEALYKYSACDISDALLKLKVPGAGFLADISQISPSPSAPSTTVPKLIAPAFTVLFVPKSSPSTTPSNIPFDKHFADLTPASHVVVISQPSGQRNAVLGGLVAARIQALDAQGVVVDGRVRDLAELREGLAGFPVWAKGTSTVGAGAESRAIEVGGEVTIEGVVVKTGDIIFADGINGVVSIPLNMLDPVLDLLPRLTGADEKVREDVIYNKRPLQDAFAEHRKGL